jgi:hypothetical protein
MYVKTKTKTRATAGRVSQHQVFCILYIIYLSYIYHIKLASVIKKKLMQVFIEEWKREKNEEKEQSTYHDDLCWHRQR